MSTQDEGFPPLSFSISQPFTTMRLLELPTELLDLVLSQAHQTKNVFLISSPALDSVADNSSKEGFLHICTDSMVWAVKQVSTSNSVYVCQTQNSGQDADSVQSELSTGAMDLTALAKPTSMLELYQIPPSVYNDTIRKDIHRLVPELDIEQDGRSSTPYNITRMTYSELYKQIPGPRQAVNLALAEAGAFETTTPSPSNSTIVQTFRPSNEFILQTWRLINEAAATSNNQVDVSSASDLFAAIERYEKITGSDHVRSQNIQVARRMLVSSPNASETGQTSMFDALRLTQDAQHNVLNGMEVTRWVGNLYLNVVRHRGTEFLDVTAFIKEWDDLVPATWVKYCSVEILNNACELSSTAEGEQQTVKWKPFALSDTESVPRVDSSETMTQATSNPAGSKNKRKWHEKFAAQRNAKK